MYYYFYKITNNINGKYYYGVHQTDNLDDGYMGSGIYLHRAYNKYGESNFTKEIIKFFNNSDEMFEYEREVVNEDLVKNPNCYNIAIGGYGGNTIAGLSEEDYLKLCEENSKRQKGLQKGENNGMYGYEWSDKQREHQSNTLKNYYNDKHNKEKFLKSLSKRNDEWRKHISESHKGKKLSELHKQSISKSNIGKKRTDETKQKISNKLRGRKNPKISEALRGKPSGTSGKHWKVENGKRIYY